MVIHNQKARTASNIETNLHKSNDMQSHHHSIKLNHPNTGRLRNSLTNVKAGKDLDQKLIAMNRVSNVITEPAEIVKDRNMLIQLHHARTNANVIMRANNTEMISKQNQNPRSMVTGKNRDLKKNVVIQRETENIVVSANGILSEAVIMTVVKIIATTGSNEVIVNNNLSVVVTRIVDVTNVRIESIANRASRIQNIVIIAHTETAPEQVRASNTDTVRMTIITDDIIRAKNTGTTDTTIAMKPIATIRTIWHPFVIIITMSAIMSEFYQARILRSS